MKPDLRADYKIRLYTGPQNPFFEVSIFIKTHDLKNKEPYSGYNFRTKEHEEHHLKTGKIPSGTASIYNQAAIDFIVTQIKNT